MNEEEKKEKAKVDLQNDIIKIYKRGIKARNRIIILLIVCMCLMAVSFVIGHAIYENQFVTVYESEEKEKEDVNISTEGENASAEYNNVNGNQYNDNAIHTEDKEGSE